MKKYCCECKYFEERNGAGICFYFSNEFLEDYLVRNNEKACSKFKPIENEEEEEE